MLLVFIFKLLCNGKKDAISVCEWEKSVWKKDTCWNVCLIVASIIVGGNGRWDNAIPVVSAYPLYTMSTVESDLSTDEVTGGVETRQRLKRNEVCLRRKRNEVREECKKLKFELRKLQERLTVVAEDGEALSEADNEQTKSEDDVHPSDGEEWDLFNRRNTPQKNIAQQSASLSVFRGDDAGTELLRFKIG